MPRYFFDVHNGDSLNRDDEGVELGNIEMVRKEAKSILPHIASEEIPKDGDRRTYTVLVTNEGGLPIYSATLSFAGLWLSR